jgi:hypothetical protein
MVNAFLAQVTSHDRSLAACQLADTPLANPAANRRRESVQRTNINHKRVEIYLTAAITASQPN